MGFTVADKPVPTSDAKPDPVRANAHEKIQVEVNLERSKVGARVASPGTPAESAVQKSDKGPTIDFSGDIYGSTARRLDGVKTRGLVVANGESDGPAPTGLAKETTNLRDTAGEAKNRLDKLTPDKATLTPDQRLQLDKLESSTLSGNVKDAQAALNSMRLKPTAEDSDPEKYKQHIAENITDNTATLSVFATDMKAAGISVDFNADDNANLSLHMADHPLTDFQSRYHEITTNLYMNNALGRDGFGDQSIPLGEGSTPGFIPLAGNDESPVKGQVRAMRTLGLRAQKNLGLSPKEGSEATAPVSDTEDSGGVKPQTDVSAERVDPLIPGTDKDGNPTITELDRDTKAVIGIETSDLKTGQTRYEHYVDGKVDQRSVTDKDGSRTSSAYMADWQTRYDATYNSATGEQTFKEYKNDVLTSEDHFEKSGHGTKTYYDPTTKNKSETTEFNSQTQIRTTFEPDGKTPTEISVIDFKNQVNTQYALNPDGSAKIKVMDMSDRSQSDPVIKDVVPKEEMEKVLATTQKANALPSAPEETPAKPTSAPNADISHALAELTKTSIPAAQRAAFADDAKLFANRKDVSKAQRHEALAGVFNALKANDYILAEVQMHRLAHPDLAPAESTQRD